MKIITIVILVLIFCISRNIVLAKDDIYVSPGIKLGYQFGKDGGFIFGIEISAVQVGKYTAIGGVLDLDFCKDNTMFHIGFQQSALPIGYDLGPSLYFKDSKTYFGYSANIFSGFIAMPFYGINYFPSEKVTIHEAGSYLKYPITIH